MIAVYARVSTEEQAKHGFGIAAQIRACQELAEGEQTLVFSDEGVSGETLNRPALEALRGKIEAGLVKTVFCLDPDRLSRKLLHQLLLTEEWERMGVDLAFVNGDYSKTPEGNLFYALRGAISEFEKAKITERMCRGRREKARQGRVLRDFSVYGYDFEPEGEQLVINHAEARVVWQIFSWFLAPPPGLRGISGIARSLTSAGIPTKRNAAKWHRQVVRQILSNRTYLGEFFQNKWNASQGRVRLRPMEEWILIPCPPIIDRATFTRAQMLLAQSRRRYAGKESTYLLSGLVRCAHCGKALKGRQWGVETVYAEEAGAGCGLKTPQSALDTEVWSWFNGILGRGVGVDRAGLTLSERRELLRILIKEILVERNGRIVIRTF